MNWDSSFFGFSTARVVPSQLEQEELEKILADLHREGVRLAYWAAQEEALYDTNKLGGRLADKKVTFKVDLRSLEPEHFISSSQVINYRPDMPEEELFDLAVQAGAYSRFARDPQFPHEKFTDLYREWMRKSLKKELADDVLIIQTGNQPIAMVTVSAKNGRGDIGLIAVAKDQRGKKHGEMLVRAAQLWYLNHNLEQAQVVTQLDNAAACKLYRKCGYEISHTDFIYHFWL